MGSLRCWDNATTHSSTIDDGEKENINFIDGICLLGKLIKRKHENQTHI